MHKPCWQPKPKAAKPPRPKTKTLQPTTLTALDHEYWRGIAGLWAMGVGSWFYRLGYGVNKLEAGGVKGYNPLGRISGWGKPKYA